MKRVVFYAAVLAATLLVPTDAQDVAKLRPVQVVSLYKEEDRIVIETDTLDRGVGDTAQAALEDLEQTTPGMIYLDTAEYLLVTREAQDVLEALRGDLKKRVQLCMRQEELDLEEVAKYLAAHDGMPELEHWSQGMELPVLRLKDERFILSQDEK